MSVPVQRLDLIDHFPGWERAPSFLEKQIVERRFRSIADVGGGANPMVPQEFVREHGLDYTVLDISREELAKAPADYEKIQVDITAPSGVFRNRVPQEKFDLAFSHMLIEHLKNPMQAHWNIHSMLRRGGLAIHFHPSPNNLPLALNRLIPEGLSRRLVRLAQPGRDLSGKKGKFPAYYEMCGQPSKKLHARFEEMGYRVVQHTGFIGHGYYSRFPAVRNVEVAMRSVLLKARLPLTSAMLLILEKR